MDGRDSNPFGDMTSTFQAQAWARGSSSAHQIVLFNTAQLGTAGLD
jgi:hypothetical protein